MSSFPGKLLKVVGRILGMGPSTTTPRSLSLVTQLLFAEEMEFDSKGASYASFCIAWSILVNVRSRPRTSRVSNSGGAFFLPHTATRMG